MEFEVADEGERLAVKGMDDYVNYMDLYDRLDDTQKQEFERIYDDMNQKRQRKQELQYLTEVDVPNVPHLSNLAWGWAEQASEYLKHEKGWSKELTQFQEVIRYIGHKQVGFIVARELCSTVDNQNNNHVSRIIRDLGRALDDEMARRLNRNSNHSAADSVFRSKYNSMYWALQDNVPTRLTVEDQFKCGGALVHAMLELFRVHVVNPKTKQLESKPAFWHSFQLEDGYYKGVIKTNERVFDANFQTTISTITKHLPMLQQPSPRKSTSEGGYIYSRLKFLTVAADAKNVASQYVKEASNHGYLDDIYRAVDWISFTAWGINSRVFKVLQTLFESGREVAQLPGVPEEPQMSSSRTRLSRRANERLKQLYISKVQDRLTYQEVLDIASRYDKYGDRFYFPYQIDFRGRAYPCTSSKFSHLGPDCVRGIMQFWYSKPLGDNGIRWLKIHLANMYGVDKVSNHDRVKFVDDNTANIMASADDPLCNRWWMETEKPFQTLAACFELTDALRSPDPAKFRSRIAVNQDGSCNGLQHYAALGGDIEGARQVNMVPASKPADVYSKVRDGVAEMIDKDTESEIAVELKGRITRKVVKQPVMTSVYGVTRYGIKNQVAAQLEELNPPLSEKFDLGQYAAYITNCVYQVRHRLFSNARNIQDWLEEVCTRVCLSVDASGESAGVHNLAPVKSQPMVWTTPLGLPVCQPYQDSVKMTVKTALQKIVLVNPHVLSPIDSYRQRNGIAPNLIHSLDSTHMFMTSLACEREGTTFASVHDSFWTHACDVDKMNTALRRQFVKLYSDRNYIDDLYDEFKERTRSQWQLVSIPDDGSSTANAIKSSRTKYKSQVKAVDAELAMIRKAYRDGDARKPHANRYPPATNLLLTALDLDSSERVAVSNNRSERNVAVILSSAPTKTRHYYSDQEIAKRSGRSLYVWVPVYIPAPPSRGHYDVSQVLNSEYFFS